MLGAAVILAIAVTIPAAVTGQCTDFLSDRNYLDVTRQDGSLVERLTDCARLIQVYPQFCGGNVGQDGGQCCASCSATNTQCFDSLSPNTAITVTSQDGSTTSLTDCATLTSPAYLYLCAREYGQDGGACCDSCKKQGPQGQCTDSLSDQNYIDVNGEDGSLVERLTDCGRLTGVYPQFCGGNVGQDGGQCCASCSGINTQCFDSLSPNTAITVTSHDGSTTSLTDCATLTSPAYLYLCAGSAGQDGGACCASCKEQNLNCYDDNSINFQINPTTYYKCAEYVADDKCRCYDDQSLVDKCCASCNAEDLSGCGCRNKLSATRKLTITKADSSVVVVDSCQTVVDQYPSLCGKGPGEAGANEGLCCEACKGVCVDSRSFVMTSNKYSCADIKSAKNRLKKRLCKISNNNGNMCCESCQ